MSTFDLAPLQERVWQTAEDQGMHVNLDPLDLRLQTLVRLALVHTEVMEADTSVAPSDTIEEFADTAIRLLELAWCCGLPLRLALPVPVCRWTMGARTRLHGAVATITQEVKRHGVTDAVAVLIEDALALCWALAQGVGADLGQAIVAKDAHNRTRAYQYGTPGARA